MKGKIDTPIPSSSSLRRFRSGFILSLCFFLCASNLGCDRGPEGIPPSFVVRNGQRVVLLPLGGVKVALEVAADEASRTRGLMGRKHLDPDRGMLFIYPTDRMMRFWMKNTFIPLSIAFIKADGTIANIEKMRPLVEDPPYMSRGLCRFALEMNQGWFEAHGIHPGDRIAFPSEVLNSSVR